MNEGWIALSRKLRDNPIYTNSTALHVWIECLFRAKYDEKEFYLKRQKVKLNPGQFVMGRDEFAKSIGTSPSTAWYWILAFKADSMVDIQTSNKGTVVTIKNWNKYQQPDSKVDNGRTADEQRMNTINKYNKENKENNNTYIGLSPDEDISKEYKNFIDWYNRTYHKTFTATSGRFQKYKARRRVFSKQDISRAFNNLKESAYHMGYNENQVFYATPDFLLRNDEQIDKWKAEGNNWK